MTPKAIAVDQVRPLIERMAGAPLHAKQVESVTNAVGGVVHAVSRSIHRVPIPRTFPAACPTPLSSSPTTVGPDA
jgi:hypothetical protein